SPRVAVDPAGGFVVAWGASDGYFGGIFARRFAASGSPAGLEFPVNTFTTKSQQRPALAGSPAGRFLIAWESQLQDGNGFGIYGRRLCDSLAGDATGNGVIDVSDVFALINALFAGGPPPVHSSDANGDGATNVQDIF